MAIVTGAGLALDADPVAAAEAAASEARRRVGGPADLAFVFFSAEHAHSSADIASTVEKTLEAGALLGCSAQGVVGGAKEVEDRPAVSVWAGRFPGTSLLTFASEFDPDRHTFMGFPERLPEGGSAILIADPYTFPADHLLRALNDEHPGFVVMGGLASGASAPGETRLVLGGEVRNGGAVGVVLDGSVRVRPLVSQGCRPIGSPVTVTGAERNLIKELGGRPSLERLRETFAQASQTERALMQRGLHIGRVIDEYKTDFERGDFLIRTVMGADPETGAIAVGDHVGVGETVQFHVRDAQSADEDLRELLASIEAGSQGALLFTCNGRGLNLFPAPDHDARAIQGALGDVALAGFFCAGELGPVGGRNFLHGFTASIALFSEA